MKKDYLVERLRSLVVKKNIPLNVLFEITRGCNLDCVHCYVVRKKERKELSLKEIKAIIDQLSQAGALFITLTGGEPLIRDDFLAIAHYIRKKGLALQIFTNGTLITPPLADEIKELHPFIVGVSL